MVEVGGYDVRAEDHVCVLDEEWSFALDDVSHGLPLQKTNCYGTCYSDHIIALCSLSKAFWYVSSRLVAFLRPSE